MITKRMQYQAIVDRLAGLPVSFTAGDFDGRLKACWEALDTAVPGQEVQAIYNVPATTFERMEFLEMLRSLKPGEQIGRLPTMAELAENLPPIDWVWRNWIPRGMLTLLGAAPGSGKSLVALDLANRIIKGEPFPDGQPVPYPGRPILYVDAEVATQIHHQRALDWQMDMDRIFMKLPGPGEVIDLSNPLDRDRLVEEVARNKPELVIIDALSNMSSRGENDIEDVRGTMMFFNHLALDSNAGFLIIHHTRKAQAIRGRPTEFTMDDIRGSGHIIAMARSVIGLVLVHDDKNPAPNCARLMRVLKSNLGPAPSPLGFELVPGEANAVFLKWGSPPDVEMIRSTSCYECRLWLVDLMRTQGELKPADVAFLARQQGFSRSILYRVRGELSENILNTRPRNDPENTWRWQET